MELLNKLFNRKNVLLISIVLIIAICFETSQQLFYLKRFSLNSEATFIELFKNQFYRWIIWFLCGIPLLFFIKSDVQKESRFSRIIKYAILIFVIVLVNILIISSISILTFSEPFSISNFYSEYFLFFTFQKAPIYTLGYIAITIILFLNYTKELLQIEVQSLEEIKKENKLIYQKLKISNSDKSKVLNIKIGNKRKIISVETILFLEADDYCVNVHTINNPAYSMRISLKSLEEKLEHHFLRVHRKSIVNMKMVKEFKLNTKPYLLLNNNEKVFVSKSNLKLVKDFLEK